MEYFFNNQHIHKIHFVGIGGISMSSLAKLCHNSGLIVSGSDSKSSNMTDELKNIGIKIFIGHDATNIDNCDTVVYTIAVKESNPEVAQAKNLGLNVFERSDFLRLVCKAYKNVIAVAGTHGKTTTTGMIASIFIEAKKDPTVHIGGECALFGGNLRIGSTDFFITEACEYKKHLLKVPHNVGVVLNIEPDHPDSYTSDDDLHNTFNKFCLMSKELSVVNEKHLVLLRDRAKCNISTFSVSYGNFTAKNIRQYKNGKITFNAYKDGKFYSFFELNMFGKHNVMNALASIATADYYHIPKAMIAKGLKNFCGIKRRFQFMGKLGSNIVIEDYAHHPTEISAVIQSAKEIFGKKIIAVFQPHTYSRTKSLLGEFLKCFKFADKIYVLPTYSAREKPQKNSSGKFLAKCLVKTGANCTYLSSFRACKKALKAENDSVILIIGAGDIEKLAVDIKQEYIKLLELKKQ